MINTGDRWAEYRRDGKVFIATHQVQTTEASSINDILIRVPSTSNITALIQSEIGDYANFSIYESPVLTSAGSIIIPRNMNRSFSDATDVLFFHTPVASENGANIYGEFSIAWLGYFNETTGVWELKKGTDYLLRCQNMSEDASYLNWRIVFRKITG